MVNKLELFPLQAVPLVAPGDDLCTIITQALATSGLQLEPGDCLVVAQKIVSKAENRYAYLNQVTVSDEAAELAQKVAKDPRIIQLILDESVEVVRCRAGVVIVEHRLGYVHANAGIDASNIEHADDNPSVLLLPKNPDSSAAKLRDALQQSTGVAPFIIINDSAGRAWRNGIIGFTIGSAGFEVIADKVGEQDLFGRPLQVTSIAVADELSAAASILQGQADEGTPVVLVRGANLIPSDQGSHNLIRPKSEDLFR